MKDLFRTKGIIDQTIMKLEENISTFLMSEEPYFFNQSFQINFGLMLRICNRGLSLNPIQR